MHSRTSRLPTRCVWWCVIGLNGIVRIGMVHVHMHVYIHVIRCGPEASHN